MSVIEIKDEILIARGASPIWKTLTDVNNWRLWSGVIDRAVLYGQVRPGTSFKCLADKWDFDCAIDEAIPGERFYTRGKTIGLDVVFRWQLSEGASSTKVLLAAEIDGWMIRLFRSRIAKGFEAAIFTWLYSLKNYSERGDARAEHEKLAKVSGRLPKKKISFMRPLGLFLPNRRDREEEE